MKEQMLFRFAMILQNQAPSTLNKYICKLSEAVLFDHSDGLSLVSLQEAINSQFILTFSAEEIQIAIQKKGKHNICITNNLYVLSDSARKNLEKETSLQDSLHASISKYLETHDCPLTEEQTASLLLNYLYYCFNSNVTNLLSLLNRSEVSIAGEELQLSNLEVAVINDFITWNNAEKDSVVYSIVSACYEYCMLTTKKDNLLSKELFKGKKFFLDANILFRMAGINNKERQIVTNGFVAHCKQAGIELLCTSDTLDELYRVITSQIEFIKSIAGNEAPVSCEVLERINPSLEINDFYKIYYFWCNQPENRCGDYISFNKYLLGLIQETLSQLKIHQSKPYKIGSNASQYESQVETLRVYKNTKRRWRNTSRSSAETDVSNVLEVLSSRKNTDGSIWQTNEFLVSADQLLIGWAAEVYTGVPIVVLPSVWLSIILRFTGRTNDDYKAFCLFLTQRQHADDEAIIDPFLVLKNLSTKTTQTKLKEQIIFEITQNKSQYKFSTNEDYDESIDRAFDTVLQDVYGKNEQQIQALRSDMIDQIQQLEKNAKDSLQEQSIISTEAGKEKAVVLLSKKQANDRVKFFRLISKPDWIYYIIAGLFLISGIVIWAFEVAPIYDWIMRIIPGKINASAEVFGVVWAIISAAFYLFMTGIKKLLSYLGSPDREEKIYKKQYAKNSQTVKE